MGVLQHQRADYCGISAMGTFDELLSRLWRGVRAATVPFLFIDTLIH